MEFKVGDLVKYDDKGLFLAVPKSEYKESDYYNDYYYMKYLLLDTMWEFGRTYGVPNDCMDHCKIKDNLELISILYGEYNEK